MSDPIRTSSVPEAAQPAIDADRDAKIESLLLSGLDHYFASEYGQAIDVWSRALFLDRQHARARAYIERARTALAEEQRESEELLHNGVVAFERGEIEAARLLLDAAVRRGGAHDVALAFLTRIDRINAVSFAATVPAAVPVTPSRGPSASAATDARSRRRAGLWVGALALAGAVLVLASRDEVRSAIALVSPGAATDVAPAKSLQDPWLVPESSEALMERAHALFASGRVYDALRAIDRVRSTDPLRREADELKSAIQRVLLAHQTVPGGGELAEP